MTDEGGKAPATNDIELIVTSDNESLDACKDQFEVVKLQRNKYQSMLNLHDSGQTESKAFYFSAP